MNREELKALGLSDEQIDKVMAAHGKVVNDTKKKADEVDGLKTQIDDYKQQLKDRDKQLDDLSKKAKDSEELTSEINQLKEANKTAKQEYEQKLQQQAFDHTLENSLNGAKVKNTKAVKALLDMETIKLDGDTLKGLDDQLKGLKESDPYLFEQEEQQQQKNIPNIVNPGNPNGGSNTPKNIADMTYQELADLKANNPAQFEQLTKN
ncbi:phage scaffolding protein [Oceanobacillus sp. J11TS1]|uniref:phage scaffolding protein n=1 Tax=Oceanobacillus sp. J11TS1 TaxID=2807191 RepID=UPI001B052B6C|nr:phage scaffolding protein [Oceanobacillus sp. J11TS1]GIO25172.1 scaffold protein [Oceanobacillus sp. J11TS1]